jgi:hypothetical protein
VLGYGTCVPYPAITAAAAARGASGGGCRWHRVERGGRVKAPEDRAQSGRAQYRDRATDITRTIADRHGEPRPQDMASRDQLSHDLGVTLRERVTKAGYQPTLEEAIEGWMNSPRHRDTLLSDKFTEFGLVAAAVPPGKHSR